MGRGTRVIGMTRYPDGRTGLAAFCDVCGEQITENGYVLWRNDESDEHLEEWVVVHQGRCDPDRCVRPKSFPYSMELNVEIIYLANSVDADLEGAIDRAGLFSGLGW